MTDMREHESSPTALPPIIRTSTTPASEDKKNGGIITAVRRLTSNSSFAIPASPSSGARPSWEPTFLRPLPLVGIGALLASICCLFASLGVLVASNGQPTDDWHPWSPSVYLAIFSAFINRATQFALVQAIPIAWWYRAYQGASLIQLQRKWEASEGFFRAIRNARYEWVMALAMTFCTLVVIDGPFLQKASSVVNERQTKPVTLNFPITPEMPTGFSGDFGSGGLATSDEAAPAISSFTYNDTITANITGCNGHCRTTVRGPGVVIKNCSSETWPLDRNTLLNNRSATWGPGIKERVAPMPLFNTQFHHNALFPPFAGPEEIQLRVGIANYTNCSGSYVHTTCSLISAILEYDVIVKDNDVLNFAQPASSARLISVANNTFINASNLPESGIPVTLSAFSSFMDGQIFSNATMEITSQPDREDGAQIMPNSASFNNFVTRYSGGAAMCEMGFLDPTLDIIGDMNNLMFRAGILAAGEEGVEKRLDSSLGKEARNQTIQAQETRMLNVFRTDLRWFAGAAILEILAIITIAPVFWGWWKLGIRITMSPLDIAKAFEAPLLKESNSGAGSRGVVKAMGESRVRLGVVLQTVGEIDPDGIVTKEVTSRRLVLAEAENVVRPRRGFVFEE